MKNPCPEREAVRLLLAQKPARLPVDPAGLRFDRPVKIYSMERFCSLTSMTMGELGEHRDLQDGCTLIRRKNGKRVYIVLYNGAATNPRRRAFTLAHELGHIYLGHLDDESSNERDANRFAAELLAPRVLVHSLWKKWGEHLSPTDLRDVFGLSGQGAALRLRELEPIPGFDEEEKILLERYAALLPEQDGPVVDF